MAINQNAPIGTPAPGKQALASNYLDFTTAGTAGWAQQYMPDLMEKEAEVFGNRTVSGFLEQVGAEEASASDQVIWSEQGRLHLSYAGTLTGAASGTVAANGKVALPSGHGLRVGDTVVVSHAGNNKTAACYVSAIKTQTEALGGAITLAANNVHLVPFVGTSAYVALGVTGTGGNDDAVTLFVYGSASAKGTVGRAEAVEPAFKSYGNKMTILKDKYEVSGSDASQIGWVEVSGEDGQAGYMWYLKAAGDTKVRFTDYCEMTMIESEVATNAELIAGKLDGTQGLFAAVRERGIIADGFAATNTLDDFDLILKEFDKQGAIEENMMFLNRDQSLQIDDMLGGQINTAAGNSYGVFNNDADMALNLGFSGFRRGSYDFYKTDWKYLNDSATRGNVGSTNAYRTAGMIVPAGTSSVYDQAMGKNIRRPFLHVRYRAAGMEDRRFKTWTTGSVGAATSDLDAMEMHFLSERCLVTQGANNFCLLESNLSS